MKTNLNVTTAREVYETMVEKIYQIPSALVSRDWQEVNVEFHKFIKEVGMNSLFKEPLLVLNSVLLFGIAEDHELGYNVAVPIYNNIKSRKGFSSIWELKLFSRVSFLLCRNFGDLKELSKYAFDFLKDSYQDKYDSIEVTSVLTLNLMYALVNINPRDSFEHKNEIEELFKSLYSKIVNMNKKFHIEAYLNHANFLSEEFKNKKEINPEEEAEELRNRYKNLVDELNKHRTKFEHKYKTEDLYSLFLKLTLGGKI